ncbi:MAG: hypothetical protein EOP10_06450 [Proteobacteria bacterium]|nr:MAG: hypothetical protein EOP10_06450 [Pseudomonadota bacterium]
MKPRLIRTLLCITAAMSASGSAAAMASDEELLDLKSAYRNLTYKVAERKDCLRYNKAGQTLGKRDYIKLFPSCTDFLLAGGSYSSFFHPMPEFESQSDRCYEAGYREAFVRANVQQWIPCMKQLGSIISDANAQSVENCRTLGETSRAAISTIPMQELTIKANESDFLNSEAYARIVFFAENGFGKEVWNDLLDLASQRQIDIFSCNLAFGSGLLGGESR